MIIGMSSAGSPFRVTLDDGTKWLVHKGDGYGISSQTVVVAARHMSTNWKASNSVTLSATCIQNCILSLYSLGFFVLFF